MREDVRLTCINCPLGCEVTVHFAGNGEMTVTGNTCPRGEIYAKKEVTNPTRIVTSSVRVKGARNACMVSVKTAQDVPKGKIFDISKALESVEVSAPVKIGDVVLANVCDTGVDVIATKNIRAV